MKTVTCKDSKLYGFKLERWGRVKSIFEDAFGRSYFRVKNKTVYLQDIMQMSYPYFYDNEDGKTGYITGYYSITYFFTVYVEILDDGYSVQLWLNPEGGRHHVI